MPDASRALTEAEAAALIARATEAGTVSQMQLTINCATEARADWAPFVDPTVDYASWGAWEAWQWLKIGPLPDGSSGAIPTGEWAAWNRNTKQQMVFSPGATMTAREQAVLFCQVQNGQIAPNGSFNDPSTWGPPDSWRISSTALCTREVELLPAAN